MSRGTFKYICEECNEENWLTKKARDSRFMPRCTSCGSTWLEPSNAKDKITTARDASVERHRMINKKMNKG